MPRGKNLFSEMATPTQFAAPGTAGEKRIKRVHNQAYTDETARKICERIMSGETLMSICAERRMPTRRTIIRWLAHPEYSEFREMYYYARRVQAELLVDEIVSIADDSARDWIPSFNKKGEQNGWKPDHEAIQRSRVRIDTRKWLAARLIPRIYGEKVDHHHELVGDLADMVKHASNQDSGLPPPIEGKKKNVG